jgi:methyl-accepting chemotaxis protein
MGYEDVIQSGAKALRETCFGINSVVPSSEKDFLAIGDHLAHFADRARNLSETALTASQLLGADRIKDIAAKLRQILEAAVSRAARAQDGLKENIQTLKQMLAQIDEISADLAYFSRTLKTLRVLGISTRIESSRFRDARFQFESLADEVERSALVIESRHKEMCGQVGTLSNSMSKVLNRALKANSIQNTNAALILERLLASLTSLEEKQASAASNMESLSGRSDDVVTSISDVIMSLQFHDICRQQMEHVGETIEDLSSSLGQKSGDGQGQAEEDASQTSCASAYRVCGLQLAQLSYTKETIVEAVERIISSMDRIANDVDSMGRDIQKMLATADDRGESYLSQLEEGAENVLSLLNENRKTGNQLGDAIRSATETSSSISKSVLAIRDIVDDIKLLSLNARVKAAIAGQEGRSVSVLSEAIERLAGDMNEISEALSHSFSALSKGASELECRLEATGCRSDEGTEQLLSDLESIRLESTEANERAMGLLSYIREEGWEFADSIRSVTRNEITVHRTVSSSLEAVASLLKGVMDCLRPFAGDNVAQEKEELRRLQDRYTMESERQIHRGQLVATPSALYAQGDTLGDNVELF